MRYVEWTPEDSDSRRRGRLVVESAAGLLNADAWGKSDPYAVLLFNGEKVGRGPFPRLHLMFSCYADGCMARRMGDHILSYFPFKQQIGQTEVVDNCLDPNWEGEPGGAINPRGEPVMKC